MSYAILHRVGATVRPFDVWPGAETADRTSSPFTAKLSDTVALLGRELEHLDAERVVLQLAIAPSRIRTDGLPYADAKCSHPGVVLSCDTPHGVLSWSCDRFVASPWRGEGGADWTHNLRAVALGLNALRTVDRYGIGDGTQYRGYAQLPAGTPMPATHMTTDEACRFLGEHSDANDAAVAAMLTDTAVRDHAYRLAAKRLHPDHGGDAGDFARLQAAKALLDREPARG